MNCYPCCLNVVSGTKQSSVHHLWICMLYTKPVSYCLLSTSETRRTLLCQGSAKLRGFNWKWHQKLNRINGAYKPVICLCSQDQ
ncbi:Helicase SKI2W [Frankliniella fusca]|uniref:Helicase SKI2W n=1 Tax=Frankliniella fusca TaxID=407009 RepID=A0AAE1LKQ6_9NEOP|nr:Helicase SKI2W [Frankliniella fusca]KAK3917860.1 Helicase SKI2W [Frankliniella fusca]KAK3921430.1 Helicase SKI2W [Frankliniella fusca]KAK3921637.1 Helicase SKI2W [Frankliniella fusca]KAK3923355.1 Helicase SKI2W [Frankliniella fusca]